MKSRVIAERRLLGLDPVEWSMWLFGSALAALVTLLY